MKGIISVLTGAVMAVCVGSVLAQAAPNATGAPGAAGSALTSNADKLSYSMGVMTGRAFKEHGVAINPTQFAQGLSDGLSGKTPQLSEQEMKQILTAFQAQAQQKYESTFKAEEAQNQKAGGTFLTQNAKAPGVKTTASGLEYKVIDAGQGASPTLTDTVTVDYEGKLLNGKVFDSSYARGKPVTFPVSGVIKGWQEALQMMKPGATWELFIPADLAYGSAGVPDLIGPNETLVFKVHLISVKKG